MDPGRPAPVIRHPHFWRSLTFVLGLVLVAWLIASPLMLAQAQNAVLTLEQITWNAAGNDADGYTTWPNQGIQLGVRVRNTGGQSNVALTFTWNGAPPAGVIGPATLSQTVTVPANGFRDVYFNITFNGQIDDTVAGQYTITAVPAAGTQAMQSFPVYFIGSGEGFWEDTLDTGSNSTSTITGPQTVQVGDQVSYNLTTNIVQNKFGLIANEILFPPDHFRVDSFTISGPGLGPIDNKLYLNPCGWAWDVTNELGACGDEANGITGAVTTVFQVTVIGNPQQNVVLRSQAYGFAGDYYYTPSVTHLVNIQAAQETATSTSTSTATTSSGTQNATATPTSTATATATVTTPASGGQSTATATATATATGQAGLSLTNAVTPAEQRVNGNLTFTIKVTNPAGSPAANSVSITTTYPNTLDITSVTTSAGTYTTNNKTITISVGDLAANSTATITVVAKVNSTVTATTNATNVASVTYTSAGSSRTVQSNTINFRLLTAGSALPGTGFFELDEAPAARPGTGFFELDEAPAARPGTGFFELDESPAARPPAVFWPALLTSLILGCLGLGALAYGALTRRTRPIWAGWYLRTGGLLFGASLLFGLFTAGLSLTSGDGRLNPIARLPGLELPFDGDTLPAWPALPGWPQVAQEPHGVPVAMESEPTALPDFPVPEPPAVPTRASGDKPPDTSQVVQIEIPSIQVASQVKYVPFDGLSWKIAGLRQEIAWMGDTSWPGLGGNTALAGHVTLRDGSEGPFRYLADLQPGDAIHIFTLKNEYIYRVRLLQNVLETDLSVLQSSSDKTQLTLITCSGWDKDQRKYLTRLVVVAELARVLPLTETAMGSN